MSHQTFWKPEKVVKEKKQWKPGQKKKKELTEWKKDILSHHKSNPSRADRAEFPRHVILELMERAGGKCEACRTRPDSETHHIHPRGRSGRGVFQNGLRVCHVCHQRIQTSEEELQYWINEWERKYGQYFWFDEQDWEEYHRKQASALEAEEAQKQRMNELEPIVSLLSTAAGRKLRTAEIRLLDGMDTREAATFAKLMQDVIGGVIPVQNSKTFAYGERFDD